MIKNNMKRGYILLLTSLVSIFIIMSIATYYKYVSTITSLEFHKDLAKIRGYWAVYGAKELETDITYTYYRLSENTFLYKIEAIADIDSITVPFLGTVITKADFDWNIIDSSNSGIKDELVHKRTLKLYIDGGEELESNKTKTYLK